MLNRILTALRYTPPIFGLGQATFNLITGSSEEVRIPNSCPTNPISEKTEAKIRDLLKEQGVRTDVKLVQLEKSPGLNLGKRGRVNLCAGTGANLPKLGPAQLFIWSHAPERWSQIRKGEPLSTKPYCGYDSTPELFGFFARREIYRLRQNDHVTRPLLPAAVSLSIARLFGSWSPAILSGLRNQRRSLRLPSPVLSAFAVLSTFAASTLAKNCFSSMQRTDAEIFAIQHASDKELKAALFFYRHEHNKTPNALAMELLSHGHKSDNHGHKSDNQLVIHRIIKEQQQRALNRGELRAFSEPVFRGGQQVKLPWTDCSYPLSDKKRRYEDWSYPTKNAKIADLIRYFKSSDR